MHPGMMAWWHARQHARACGGGGGCGAEAHAGPADFGFGPPWARHRGGPVEHSAPDHDGEMGGGFGVRRPLRFLAHKLDLRDEQVAELARVLDDLKTERAQGAVDHRRTTAAFADAVAGEAFDEAAVTEAAAARVKSAERLREAVVKALGRIHAILDADQRAKLAYLLRTGALAI